MGIAGHAEAQSEREGRMRRREAESGRGGISVAGCRSRRVAFAPGRGLLGVFFWVARKTDFGYKWL
jgi:hypothetical protein